MSEPPAPTPIPPGGYDPVPGEAEQLAEFERALARETRPFFGLAGLPIASARWAERSIWPQGERGDQARAFVSLVVRYGDDDGWATVGTWFGQYPKNDPSDARRESLVRYDMAFGLGLAAAEPGDGEACTNHDGMLARIRAAHADAESTEAASLIVDGESIDAFTASVGEHRRTYFYVPFGGAVFLHTCRWTGPVALQRSLEYAAIDRDGW